MVPKLLKNSATTKVYKVGGTIIVSLAIFLLGLGIGNGTIAVGRDTIFRRSVQKDLPQNLTYKEIEELYDDLRNSFDGQLNHDQLLDGLKNGLARASGDPYTEFLNEEETEEFNEQINGTFEGIGAELGKENESIIVVTPIAGFPAEKAGLKSRDVIAEIDGESTYELTINEAVKKIRGPKGTKVTLTIVRDGDEVLKIEITRDQITIPSVTSEIISGVGYMKIVRFGDDTTKLAREAARKFKDANVKGVVVDMRNNPGGLLDSAVEVASLWLKDKKVLEERRGGQTVETFMSKGTPVLLNVPTIVLINEGSASASEIVAGALKDNDAAKVIGKKSFGKGSVQELRNLKSGGILKVTIARWYTPAGRNIEKEGIEPDKTVEITEDDIKAGRDPQKDTAISQLTGSN